MFGIDDALLVGGLAAGASMFGSSSAADQSRENVQMQIAGQQQMQKQTEEFNSAQAAAQRDWQTQMSNTAYQRSRVDMEAAGLNPILAAGAGGASTPGGSTASVGTPTMPKVDVQSKGAMVSDAISKAVNSAIAVKTADKMQEEIANIRATEARTAAETATEQEQPERVRASTTLTRNEAERLAALYPTYRLAGKSAKDIEALPDVVRRTANEGGFLGGKVSDVIAPFVSGASAFRRYLPTRSRTETTRDDGSSSFSDRFESIGRNPWR